MKRVLIVDDDLDILEALASALEEKYQVGVARDGEEAFALLARERFDAVVLDLMMPLLNGEGLLKRLAERGMRVPILLTSASRDLEDEHRRLGAADFLRKPFDLKTLRQRLASLLGGEGGGGGTTRDGHSEAGGEDVSPLDRGKDASPQRDATPREGLALG